MLCKTHTVVLEGSLSLRVQGCIRPLGGSVTLSMLQTAVDDVQQCSLHRTHEDYNNFSADISA